MIAGAFGFPGRFLARRRWGWPARMNTPLVGVAVSNSRAALVALAVAGLRVVLASGLVGGKPGGPQPADRLHESARATVALEGTMPYPPDRLWAHGRGRHRTARDRAVSRRAPRVARRSPVGPRRRRHGVQAPAGRAGDFQQRRVQRGAGGAMGAAVFWALPGLAPGAHRRKNGSGLAPGQPWA